MVHLYRAQKRRIQRLAAKERHVETWQRYRIILLLNDGRHPTEIHRILGTARSTVYRVERRFHERGEDGLRDRRREVASRKVDAGYQQRLAELIYLTPRDLGWQRSTWTTELLSRQLAEDTGIVVHRTHVRRLLRRQMARWGRPRPSPLRYTTRSVKTRKANKIKRFVDALSTDEVAVYADEVDVHLNPKIGPCWMPHRVQFEVETPGQNQKRYLFGGLNPKTGALNWLAAERKNSAVFVQWLAQLRQAYPYHKLIHVVCDNYSIHKSKLTTAAVAAMGNIRLHFLPPYSPEHNPIERIWGELHANVTRNHKHKRIDSLMDHVGTFLEHATPYPGARPSLARAAPVSVADR